MNLIVVTPPPVEPVSLEDVYTHLRLDTDDSPPTHPHDAMLQRHIRTSRGEAERITKRAFVEQTLRLIVDRFPCSDAYVWGERWASSGYGGGYIELLRPPVQSVLFVGYYDENNALQTIDPGDYFLTDDLLPRLQFVEAFSAPTLFARRDAVRIDYVAGYAPEGSPPEGSDYAVNVPSEIKDAILFGVQLLYDPLEPREREALEACRDNLLLGLTIQTF